MQYSHSAWFLDDRTSILANTVISKMSPITYLKTLNVFTKFFITDLTQYVRTCLAAFMYYIHSNYEIGFAQAILNYNYYKAVQS